MLSDKQLDYFRLKQNFKLLKILLFSTLAIKGLSYGFMDLVYFTGADIVVDEKLFQTAGMLFNILFIWSLFVVEGVVRILKKYNMATVSPALWAIGCFVPFLNIGIVILVWRRSNRLLKELR